MLPTSLIRWVLGSHSMLPISLIRWVLGSHSMLPTSLIRWALGKSQHAAHQPDKVGSGGEVTACCPPA